MSLFSDLYNKVAKFFRSQEETDADASKSVATNRLKLVLMQDRTNLTPRILEQMRGELIDLLSRNVELDKELLDLNFEQDGNQVALMLSIPVIRAKDEDEIEAAIKEHEEALKASIQNHEETDENSSDENNIENTEDINDNTETITDTSEENITRTEEELAEAEKADAIAHELQDVPKIIKKKEKNKEISAPDEMNGNPFKNDSNEAISKIEITSEN